MTPPAARMVQMPGARLWVDQRGDAPATVFLHGLGSDLHSWDALWRHFPGDALRYDMRGFGRSVADAPVPFGHVDDLVALLDALGLERCDLVGVSMGGAVALGAALDHPARVRRLVLVSPAIAGWDWSGEWRALWRPIAAAARAGRMDEARDLWWRHPLFATTRDGPAGAALHASIMGWSGAQWIRDDQRPTLPDVERLHLLRAPTLLLSGEHDMADFHLIADLIAAVAPGVTRIDGAGVGHLLHLEDPAGCAAHIATFLAAIDIRQDVPPRPSPRPCTGVHRAAKSTP